MNYTKIANKTFFISNNRFIAFCRHILYVLLRNKIKKRGNSFCVKGLHYHNLFMFNGRNNTLSINNGSLLKNCFIRFRGNNNTIIIGKNCSLNGVSLVCLGDGCTIYIGDHCDVGKHSLIASGEGKTITIGDHALISYNVEIRNTDSHSILNLNGDRVNDAKDIDIGSYCWISCGSIILKGTRIGHDCVIGAHSVVTIKEPVDNCVLSGVPAKIIKENVKWVKDRV